MRSRIGVRIGDQHLITLPLHEHVLLLVLDLIYLFRHVLLVTIDGLALHVLLLLLIGIDALVVRQRRRSRTIWRLLARLLVRSRLLLRSCVRLLSLIPLRSVLHLLLVRMAAILAGVLNILILAITIRLLVHGDILVRVLPREESRLGLAFSDVVDHAAKLRRRALALRKMRQVLQYRLLALITELVLAVTLHVIVKRLLIRQGLLELQLLLHLLLLVCQFRVLARCLLIVYRVVGHLAHLVFLWRVLVALRADHHHLLVRLGALHVELIRSRMRHVATLARYGGPQARGRIVLRSHF